MLESKNRTGRRQTKGITGADPGFFLGGGAQRNRKTNANWPPNKQIPKTGFEKV